MKKPVYCINLHTHTSIIYLHIVLLFILLFLLLSDKLKPNYTEIIIQWHLFLQILLKLSTSSTFCLVS